MSQEKSNNVWVKKIIRVRSDYVKVCDYLEFLASKNDINRRQFFSDVFKYSLDSLTNKGFSYEVEEYKPRRIPKGFTIKKSESDKFDIAYAFYKSIFLDKFCRKLYTADFAELVLYIYCHDNLSNDDLKQIDINWGISRM